MSSLALYICIYAPAVVAVVVAHNNRPLGGAGRIDGTVADRESWLDIVIKCHELWIHVVRYHIHGGY